MKTKSSLCILSFVFLAACSIPGNDIIPTPTTSPSTPDKAIVETTKTQPSPSAPLQPEVSPEPTPAPQHSPTPRPTETPRPSASNGVKTQTQVLSPENAKLENGRLVYEIDLFSSPSPLPTASPQPGLLMIKTPEPSLDNLKRSQNRSSIVYDYGSGPASIKFIVASTDFDNGVQSPYCPISVFDLTLETRNGRELNVIDYQDLDFYLDEERDPFSIYDDGIGAQIIYTGVPEGFEFQVGIHPLAGWKNDMLIPKLIVLKGKASTAGTVVTTEVPLRITYDNCLTAQLAKEQEKL